MTPSEQYISRLEARGKWDKLFTPYIIDLKVRSLMTYSYYVCDLCGKFIQGSNNQASRVKIIYRDSKQVHQYQIKSFYVCSDITGCDHTYAIKSARPKKL